MASRRLMFDATRHPGASPAGRSMLHASRTHTDLLSPPRALATPTRPAQRASLVQMHQAATDAAYSPAAPGAAAATPPARRSALQAITNREPRPGQASAEARPGAAALTAEQQREQKARVAEWIIAYRKAFPSFVFYFEGIDEATVHRLSAPIRSLGGKVETFFSAQTVTHVIVEHPVLASDEGAAACSHVVALARQFQLKIWDATKLEKRVLGMLLPGYSAAAAAAAQGPSVHSAKRKLSEAFSAEKLYAMRHKTFEGASVAHCVDFYYFKYFYLLVEDATHLHRPALLEDFRPPEPGRDPPWPKLYMVPTGRCPFVQYEDPTTSSKGTDTDADDNKENVTPEPEPTMPIAHPPSKTPASRLRTPRRAAHDTENGPATPTRPPRGPARTQCLVPAAHGHSTALPLAPAGSQLIMDSNASGIARSHTVTSTSTAFGAGALDPAMQRSLLQNLNGGRVTHLSRLEQPAAVGPRIAGPPAANAARVRGRGPPIPRTVKPRVAARRPAVARPGYCENCRVKFADMLEHVRSPEHQRFADNDSNWTALDAVIDRVQRPPCQPEEPPAAGASRSTYTLSSDDGSVAAAAVLDDRLSLDASWASNPSAHFCSALTSAQPLASGRLSTEAAEGPARRMAGSGVAANSVYLSYSTTSTSLQGTRDNSELPAGDCSGAADDAPQPESSEGPLAASDSLGPQQRYMATPLAPTRSIEALVSSLETPQFRSAGTERGYDGAATLVGDELARRKRARHTAAAAAGDAPHLATPTRPRQWQAQPPASPSGGATLVQPARVKHRLLARDENDAPPPPASDKLAMAARLGHMLHNGSGTP